MELYRRSDSPYWWVSLPVLGQKRPCRFSTKRRDKGEARRVAYEEEKKIVDQHQLGVKPEMTLEEGFDRYVAGQEGSGSYRDACRIRDKILGRGRWAGKVFNLPPTMKLSQLRTHHVTELREKRKQEGL